MYKWFFIASVIRFAASDEESFTFHPQEAILAECIEHNLAKIDNHYNSTQVAIDIADLAAKRFTGKTMPSKDFNSRFNSFYTDLRSKRKFHKISKDQLTKKLRSTVKQALIICGDDNPLQSADDAIFQKKIFNGESTHNNEWISFTPDRHWLSACIETHLKLTGRAEFHQEDGFTKIIADIVARRNFGKVSSMMIYHRRNKDLFYKLRSNRILHNLSSDKLSAEFELLCLQAVDDCAMDKIPLVPAPILKMEPTGISQLLNLILVKWPDHLRLMIQSRIGRRVLRCYADDALTALIRELNLFQNNTNVLRLALRHFWNNRARKIYDAYSADRPYIKHSYSLNYPTAHITISDYELFINQRLERFSDRNPLAPNLYLNEILNIHRPDPDISEGKIDIFDIYKNVGITSAEYYFENQINQFYRILFFFLELRARGICTDEDDIIYDGPLPKHLVPEQIQAIVYDDDVYRDYLEDERHFYKMLLGINTKNGIVQTLFENRRVWEENLILLRSNIPSSSDYKFIDEFPSVTTVKTTTQSLKKKDEVWKNENGKCFPCKRAKMNSLSDSNGIINNSIEKIFNESTNLPLHENHNSFVTDSVAGVSTMDTEFFTSQEQSRIENNSEFGYMAFSEDDFHQMQFLYEDLFFREIPLVDFLSDERCLI